ncbi:HU family DNA-binding protein [Deferribacter abyssi]|uniref:HU family DNA-binding protein n=1 Tax=Deferribacter abyssi TaxID=213806 RepID=UPI003C1C5BC0
MNKKELIEEISKKSGVKKSEVELVVNAFFKVVNDTVKRGEPVNVIGFGKFVLTERGERKVRNIKTGEEMVIPAKKIPRFVAGKKFKEFAI